MGEGARGARLKSSNYDLYRHCYWKKLTVSLKSPEALYYHLLTRKAARNALGESFLFIMTNINLKSIMGLILINKKLSQGMFRGCLFRILPKGPQNVLVWIW